MHWLVTTEQLVINAPVGGIVGIYPTLFLPFPNKHFTLYWGSGGRVGTWGHIKQSPPFWNFDIEVGNLEYLKTDY